MEPHLTSCLRLNPRKKLIGIKIKAGLFGSYFREKLESCRSGYYHRLDM